MINFLHTYIPESVLFSVGPVTIHWYGIMLALGFLAGVGLLHVLFKKYHKDTEQIYTLIMYIVIPALVGARLYYVLYAWKFYVHNFSGIFKVWEGGLAIHGVLLGGILGLWFYTKKYKESIVELLDILAPCVVLGQAIGRWGNYFNQELHGTPTHLPWGIPIQYPPVGFEQYVYFHPTFLYESILNIIVLVILLLLHNLKQKKSEKFKLNPGELFFIYIILYSIIRFSMEFLRIDYSPLVFNIRWAQLISIGIIIFIILVWVVRRKRLISKM